MDYLVIRLANSLYRLNDDLRVDHGAHKREQNLAHGSESVENFRNAVEVRFAAWERDDAIISWKLNQSCLIAVRHIMILITAVIAFSKPDCTRDRTTRSSLDHDCNCPPTSLLTSRLCRDLPQRLEFGETFHS